MKRFLLTGVALALAAASAPRAEAADSSNKEVIGVGAGAAIGAAVAGPPGVVLGAAIGAFFGDRSHKKDQRMSAMDQTLSRRDETIDSLTGELATQRRETRTLQTELQRIDDSGVRELHELLVRGLEIDLPFRTAEAELPGDLETRVSAIASLLATTPGLRVQVDGYADLRGSVDDNMALSIERAEHVRDLLTAAGVDAARILTFGHGEPMTTDAQTDTPSADQLALQRRVSVTFYREPTSTGVATLSDSTTR